MNAQGKFEQDVIKTGAGDLTISFIGHGSLMFNYQGKVIHVDPWSPATIARPCPKADLILLTHQHRDHLDPAVLERLRSRPEIVLTQSCAEKVPGGRSSPAASDPDLPGSDHRGGTGLQPPRRVRRVSPPPQGRGNGYVITFGGSGLRRGRHGEHPGDEGPEGIDVAFLPMNLPFTMTPEMVADAAKAFRPKVLYPYHFGNTDLARLLELMKDAPTSRCASAPWSRVGWALPTLPVFSRS